MTSQSSRPPVTAELFTVRGRTNRGRYWLVVLVLTAINLVVIGITLLMPPEITGIFLILAGLVWLVTAVIGVLTSIRRLHDRDKSGHWLWLLMVLPGVLNIIGNLINLGEANPSPASMVLPAIAFGISIWAFVELGCLRGTSGPNRFGPDPLQALA